MASQSLPNEVLELIIDELCAIKSNTYRGLGLETIFADWTRTRKRGLRLFVGLRLVSRSFDHEISRKFIQNHYSQFPKNNWIRDWPIISVEWILAAKLRMHLSDSQGRYAFLLDSASYVMEKMLKTPPRDREYGIRLVCSVIAAGQRTDWIFKNLIANSSDVDLTEDINSYKRRRIDKEDWAENTAGYDEPSLYGAVHLAVASRGELAVDPIISKMTPTAKSLALVHPVFGHAIRPAIRFIQADSLRILLNHGADPNTMKPSRSAKDTVQNALCYAMQCSSEDVAMVLLTTPCNLNLNYNDKSKETLLTQAVQRGWIQVVSLLLKQDGIDPDLDIRDERRRTKTPLAVAATYGYTDIATLLLRSPGVDPGHNYLTIHCPLWRAAENGHAEIVRALLDSYGRDISLNEIVLDEDWNGHTILSWAASRGHQDVVRVLLDFRRWQIENPDLIATNSPMWTAITNGHFEVLDVLLDYGAMSEFGIETVAELEAKAPEIRSFKVPTFLAEHLISASRHGWSFLPYLPISEEYASDVLKLLLENDESRLYYEEELDELYSDAVTYGRKPLLRELHKYRVPVGYSNYQRALRKGRIVMSISVKKGIATSR